MPVLLGLSATLSHTAVVWAVAMAGLYFGRNWNMDGVGAYFQLASAVIVLGVAAWMIRRTSRAQATCFHHHGSHEHRHHHSHEHGHCDQHGHEHAHAEGHAAAHEADIQERFANQSVTTPQIVMFGLTGGLIPCPASVAVLLCLLVKRMALGATLVMWLQRGLGDDDGGFWCARSVERQATFQAVVRLRWRGAARPLFVWRHHGACRRLRRRAALAWLDVPDAGLKPSGTIPEAYTSALRQILESQLLACTVRRGSARQLLLPATDLLLGCSGSR